MQETTVYISPQRAYKILEGFKQGVINLNKDQYTLKNADGLVEITMPIELENQEKTVNEILNSNEYQSFQDENFEKLLAKIHKNSNALDKFIVKQDEGKVYVSCSTKIPVFQIFLWCCGPQDNPMDELFEKITGEWSQILEQSGREIVLKKAQKQIHFYKNTNELETSFAKIIENLAVPYNGKINIIYARQNEPITRSSSSKSLEIV
jgi:hypothetical protein